MINVIWNVLSVLASGYITKRHSLGGLKDRNLFSHGSGGYKSEIRVPALLDSCEAPLPAL